MCEESCSHPFNNNKMSSNLQIHNTHERSGVSGKQMTSKYKETQEIRGEAFAFLEKTLSNIW